MADETSGAGETRSNWGRWGSDDERGAVNLITPEVVMRASESCKTGKVYQLALPIPAHPFAAASAPHRPLPMRLTSQNLSDLGAYARFGATDVGSNEDVFILHSHNETHIDALCHVYHREQMYNGFGADTMKAAGGAQRLGIEKTGPIVTRAVLLDVAAHHGVEALEPGYGITSADLEACAEAQGVEVRSGDVLLVRTGYLGRLLAETARLGAGQSPVDSPGLSLDAVQFVHDHDVVAVGSDNSAIEVKPFDQYMLSVHVALLIQLGVYLIEHLWLDELAADRAYESLLVVAPLRVVGATGSPVNPIAIA
jgi:kynurenine formamidase